MKLSKKILSVVLGVAMICTSIGVYEYYPKADSTKIRCEAEDADVFVQGSASNEYSIAESENYSGGKAIGNMDTWPENGRAYCETKVTVEEAGMYKMTVAYGGGEANHPCNIDVRVNEGEWISTLAEPTASWDVVSTISLNIELNAGENVIDVTGACNIYYSDMNWEWVNIDYFELEKIDGVKTSLTAKSMVDNGQMRMVGRTLTEDTAQSMDYSCSGFQFEFTGKGNIEANFTAQQASKMVVDINGDIHTVTIGAGTSDITLAEGLEQGAYIVKAYKVTEAAGYLTQLNSIGYYDETATFKATQESQLKFEFVGDSITCGNQINSDSGDEDGYYAFPSVLSRAYGADWSTVSCSGRGLMEGYNSEEGWAASKNNQLKDLFQYQSWFRDNETKYDYSYQPDVLIMGVGSNDLGEDIMQTFGTTIDDFCDEVKTFASSIREKYPDTYILWNYGTYLNNDYAEEYQAAIESLGDDNMGFVKYPQMVGGKDGHPNYIQHVRMAKMLSENIAAKLNVDNPMEKDAHYELEDGVITANGTEAAVKEEEFVSVYSGNKYVANMNTTVDHPSNGGYVTVPVTAEKAGNYKVTVTYGSTTTDPVMAVRSNNYEWTKVTGTVGTDWNATRTFETTVYLKAGENTISVTGAINGAWANMDCIDIEYVSGGEEPDAGTEPDPTEPPETSSSLPGAVRYEAEDADSYETGAVGSEHTIAESDKFSGGKAVGNMNAWADDGRAYLTKEVSVDVAGTYQLTIAYAGSEAGNEPTIDARVNNGAWKSVKVSATAGWDQTQTVTLKFNLKAGENTVDITGACQVWYGDGQAGQWVNIDYFELTKVADEADETTANPVVTTKAPVTTKQPQATTKAPTTKRKVKAPGKAVIKKAKNVKGRKVKLTFKKITRAKGYQVKYATNKKLKKAKTRTTKKLTLTIKKLKKKKTYYFKARAYVLNGKAKRYGAWSKVKKVRIKK